MSSITITRDSRYWCGGSGGGCHGHQLENPPKSIALYICNTENNKKKIREIAHKLLGWVNIMVQKSCDCPACTTYLLRPILQHLYASVWSSVASSLLWASSLLCTVAPTVVTSWSPTQSSIWLSTTSLQRLPSCWYFSTSVIGSIDRKCE